MSVTRYFLATGRVQGVMFRQTLMRAAIREDIRAGATNLPDRKRVAFTLQGDPTRIETLATRIGSGEELNSWHASAEVKEVSAEEGIDFEAHQVTTETVDNFNWSKGVEMYL